MNGKAPDAFRTISEVADWLGVNAHVLRFWESKFTQVKPVKRAGGRRYYRPSDMELLGGIQKLLHEDGLTIKGVQKVLREQGIRAVCSMSKPIDAGVSSPSEEAPAIAEPAAATPQAAAQPEAATVESAAASDDAAESTQAPEAPEFTEQKEPPAEIRPVVAAGSNGLTAQDDSKQAQQPPETVAPPSDAPEVLPLFTHQETPDMASHDAASPESGQARGLEAVPDLDGRETTSDEAEIEAPKAAPKPGPGPTIAPLPGPELTVAEALTRLAPLQVDPALLRPIHARLVALRDRMDASG